jgi:hypothetical protein
MNQKYLTEDEELEKNLHKFVDDTWNFQSRHHKSPQNLKKSYLYSENFLQRLSSPAIVKIIYHETKFAVRREFRREYSKELKSKSHSELMALARKRLF